METLKVKTRSEITELMIANNNKIKRLNDENLLLEKESILLSDNEQWFTQEMEKISYRENRKKVTVEKLIGRIHWNEVFKDEDDPKNSITVERSKVVMVDGEWRF